ncbi:Ger(x)C family spore germination protein [Bacillus thuringiensis]|uniref:Ger(x)C family spore germination protein n=1 Tax=Bacillus thuringiensis TaxID=1428 RepID=UPI00031A29F5|nr:Ger(x)C family spore germination protein [Bacillus thuringiensis]
MNLFLVRNIIKLLNIFFLFSASILLTGCWDRREVNDIAIVLGAAIDKAKGNNIKLAVQFLVPQAIDGQQKGGGQKVLMRSAIGQNLADAASKLQIQLPRKLFWGHCKVYIIGNGLAKGGKLKDQIDFIIRFPEARDQAYLFVSSGKAGKVLEFEPLSELHVGEGLRKISEMHLGVTTTAKDFEEEIVGDTRVVVLPLIKMIPAKKGEKGKTFPLISGAAIFKQNKMIGQIDTKITRGLLWLREEVEVNAITTNFQKGESISLEPLQQKTELFPIIENGKWKILVKIELEGSVIQNASTLEIKRPNITKKLEENVEKKVKQLINTTLNQVQIGLNADAFGFADAFHREYPKEWKKVKNQWDKVLSQVDVKIDVKARISRTGLSSAPTGLKENEVQKK